MPWSGALHVFVKLSRNRFGVAPEGVTGSPHVSQAIVQCLVRWLPIGHPDDEISRSFISNEPSQSHSLI